MEATLQRLAEWYLALCDGDWEHDSGPRISTLDNPGWMVSIRLAGTSLEGAVFETMRADRTEHDWVYCTVQDDRFEGRGGPLNLEELIRTFTDWASRFDVPTRLAEAKQRHGLG